MAAFFATLAEPFLRVCGSCGELANSKLMWSRLFSVADAFYQLLCSSAGVYEVIPEGTVDNADGLSHIWLCSRCNLSLTKRIVPVFSRVSEFRLRAVPNELSVLNRTEVRLIGLGVCFTNCISFHRYGQ